MVFRPAKRTKSSANKMHQIVDKMHHTPPPRSRVRKPMYFLRFLKVFWSLGLHGGTRIVRRRDCKGIIRHPFKIKGWPIYPLLWRRRPGQSAPKRWNRQKHWKYSVFLAVRGPGSQNSAKLHHNSYKIRPNCHRADDVFDNKVTTTFDISESP